MEGTEGFQSAFNVQETIARFTSTVAHTMMFVMFQGTSTELGSNMRDSWSTTTEAMQTLVDMLGRRSRDQIVEMAAAYKRPNMNMAEMAIF